VFLLLFLVVEELFGEWLDFVIWYGEYLVDIGVAHGFIGFCEVLCFWDWYLVNCVLFIDFFLVDVSIIDVGVGVGLFGIVLVLCWFDFEVMFVELLLC